MKRKLRIVGYNNLPVRSQLDFITRAVVLENGWSMIQTWGETDGWQEGGEGWEAFLMGERADRESLEEWGYTEKEIEEILAEPTGYANSDRESLEKCGYGEKEIEEILADLAEDADTDKSSDSEI